MIALDEAITEIVQTWLDAPRETGITNPFVFIVGAGISYPSIPLAEDIIAHCKARARASENDEALKFKWAVDRYSYWFKRAYSQTRSRQKYLQRLIENQPISPANLRLAHLLMANFADVVITPNFDDFVARSLRLFGRNNLRICDKSGLGYRIDPEEREVQVVHVHGTYQYYDLSNLKAEIRGVARPGNTTPDTMIGLLDHIFIRRSPLVLGYSGWSKDVIMTALRRRLFDHNKKEQPLQFNLYWFCYDEDAIRDLDSHFYSHQNVVLVVPANVLQRSGKNHTVNHSQSDSSRLTALTVFDALVRAMNLPAPRLVTDPLDFIASQLEEILDLKSRDLFEVGDISTVEGRGRQASDPYSIESVVRRLRKVRPYERQLVAAMDKMEYVRNAVRESRYEDAIVSSRDFSFSSLELADLLELRSLLSLSLRHSNIVQESDRARLKDINSRILEDQRQRQADERDIDYGLFDNEDPYNEEDPEQS